MWGTSRLTSPFLIMEIINPVRAKSGYIEVERHDKYGKRKPQKTRQHITLGAGMFSGKEMEKVMQETAKDLGVSEDAIHIETYKKGEAPIEANPRHRGLGHNWDKPVNEATHVPRATKEIRVRTVFSGWEPPTPEELEEFERRKA